MKKVSKLQIGEVVYDIKDEELVSVKNDVVNNSTKIGQNTVKIGVVESDVASNKSNIATNTQDIMSHLAENQTKIEILQNSKVDKTDIPENILDFKTIYITQRLPENISEYVVDGIFFTYDNVINWHLEFWEQGSINSTTGVEVESDIRVRTKGSTAIELGEYKVFINNGKISVLQYDDAGNFLQSTGWMENGGLFSINSLNTKIRVVLMRSGEPVIDANFPGNMSKPIVTRVY